MKKQILQILVIIVIVAAAVSGAYAQSQRYVRKKVQPNFFIPQGELSETKVEKVGIPQYRQGKSTAKHISADDERRAELEAARQRGFKKQQKKQTPQMADETRNATAPVLEPETQQVPIKKVQTKNAKGDEVPDYQQKYQEYLQDLDAIAETGSVTNNPGVDDDLGAMNSDKRIDIDKKFNEKRDVKSEVNKLLR